ncbi:MAG: hypothetical protein IT221_13510 [Fluviicola sp.]|nr:hypothetical protein [Fluviicola sp.]
MKNLIILIGSLLPFQAYFAQSVNNTTDGSVNILAPHSIVGVSTNEGLVTASYYWYGDSSIFCKKENKPYAGLKPIFGTQLQAKNESGIASIFNKGDFTPTGKIGITIGTTWNNYQKILDEINPIKKKLKDSLIKNIRKVYTDSIMKEIDAFGEKNKDQFDISKINSFKQSLQIQFFDYNSKASTHLIAGRNQESLVKLVDMLLDKIIAIDKQLSIEIKKLETPSFDPKRKYHRFSIFGNFSMQALEFKHYEARDTLILSNNFTDKTFYGADFRLGFNYNIDVRWMFGITAGFRRWNTFEALTDKEYTLTTSSTIGNTTLKSDKKITGYSGDYDEFNQFTSNVDIVFFFYDMDKTVENKGMQMTRMDEKSYNKEVRNIFAINPYFSLKNSLNKTVFPNVMTAGVNVFTFKPNGNYNVGFFLELYDIENNVAKMDPEANLRQGYQRLSFGIVTKLALSSMFSPAF